MSHKSRSFASSKNESPSSFARLEPLAANANGPSIVSTAAVVRPRAAAFGRDAEVVATARRRAVALGPFPLAAPRLRRETGARPTRAQRRLAGRHRLLRDSPRVPRSAFASCPVCGAEVAVRLMNDHLDGPRCGAPTRPPRPDPPPAPSLPGHFLMAAITEAEEAELLAFVDGGEATNPWHPPPSTENIAVSDGASKWIFDFARFAPRVVPCPAFDDRARGVRARRRPGTCARSHEFRPNEANAIEYDRAAGSVLLPHVDDPPTPASDKRKHAAHCPGDRCRCNPARPGMTSRTPYETKTWRIRGGCR